MVTKKEWQKRHGFDAEDMKKISFVKKLFKGKIVRIIDEKGGEKHGTK